MINCACWNVRSLNNKVDQVMNFLDDSDIAIFFVTETWLTDQNNNTTAQLKSHGYRIYHVHRSEKNGGGVGIIFKSHFQLTKVFVDHEKSFEAISVKLKLSDGAIVFCSCIYRPPGPLGQFLADFEDFLGNSFTKYKHFLVCGEVNIHLERTSAHVRECKWNNILSSFGLHQLVASPTHKKGHILDPVISSHKIVDQTSVSVRSDTAKIFPSCDHYPIIFQLLISPDINKCEKVIHFRNIRQIVQKDFNSDLKSALTALDTENRSFKEAVTAFDENCQKVLDSHAPEYTKTIKDVPTAPWFDGEYKAARAERRKAEKQWKKTELEIDRSIFVHLRQHCQELADKKKQQFFKDTFVKYKHSQKSLYKFMDTFLDRDSSLTLPSIENLQDTVDTFNHYFTEKIEKIRSSFPSPNTPEVHAGFNGQTLSEFSEVTIFEIREIIKESGIKTSSIDPLPKELLSEHIEILLPSLCDIVNASLSSGSVDGVKLAHLTPLIKSQSLDTENLKNYRPISNLTFIGKLIERCVLKRLNRHLSANNLNIDHQSGYKKYHSTETLLITIVNDLLVASNENNATVVMLLDLSAAFDTVDHHKLLNILRHEIGIEGTAFKWFEDFITGRCQRVRVENCESAEIIIRFGVPQGSVLGPVLFNIYIRSIYSSVKSKKFSIHGYADDHQIYKSFPSNLEYQVLCEELPSCFQEIEKWMSGHFLQLNPGKTEIIVFGSRQTLSELDVNGVFIQNSVCVRLVNVCKNLGFTLDSLLTLDPQIKKLKASICHKLRNIAKMKPFLSEGQMQIIVQSLIISSLDYCNAIYYGASKPVLKQLQSLQNRACRIVKGLKRRDDVTPHLKDLHWLKVQERIEFKLLLLTYKCLHGLAPSYLSNLINYCNSSSSRDVYLYCPIDKSSRSFSMAAPRLWNDLPQDIRLCPTLSDFKGKLKAHLFRKSFDIY